MRKRFLLFVLMLVASCAALWAQAPQAIAYQSVLRDANGVLITNSTVSVRISICQGSSDGIAVYVERHSATTNANGLVTLQIGKGLPMVGSFADIDWADGPYFAVSEIDPDGGTDYRATIVQQILSVPYALYAERAANCTNEEVERHLETHDAQIARLYRLIDSLHGLAPSDPCLEPIRTVVEQTACDLYEWHGNLYTESGDYTYTTTTAAGCDSTVTLRLSLYQTARYTEEQAICEGSIYVWRGGTYFTTGEYTYTAPAGNTGCDSVLTLRLIIFPSVNTIEEQTAEGSFTWIDGNLYTESGDYTYTTTTAAGCDSTVTLRLTITLPSTQTEGGALMGQFAVSATKKVRFSQGNLQYQASSKTWRFAEHQYDFVGADNGNISSTYSGWIDLFGWGTSGWNSGATYYQPYSTNTSNAGYKIGGNAQNDMTGNYAKADWGVNNAIINGGGEAGMWRTLASAEWDYLINGRTTAFVSNGTTYNIRYCRATVADHAGLIIFPDSYTLPAGLPMPNESGTFADYILSETQWNSMEAAGAVFLPAAGYRNGTTVGDADAVGIYWSSTHYNDNSAYRFYISRSGVKTTTYNSRSRGFSVRLVQEMPDPCEGNTSATTDVQTACDSYEWHGTTYTESTTATYTTVNAAGCDSVVTLDLTINHPSTGIDEQTAEGTYIWIDGNTYTESGDYTYTIEGGNAAGCDSTVTLHLTITQYVSPAVDGALPGVFAVSATQQVHFSQGNLQYQASSKTWRFAEHQYDFVGADNGNISSTYSGWIDLFGWGTSGWNSGATYYQPYSTNTSNAGYKIGGNAQNDMTGNYAKADWGVNNAIINGGGASGQWRTPASAEWNYLINGRTTEFVAAGTTYNIRYCHATVADHAGLIIFPDSYTLPAGLPLPNESGTFADYILSETQWNSMEAAGAVFLPAAGYRNGTTISDADAVGIYWTATHYNDNNAYRFYISRSSVNATSYHNRSRGFSVRLIQEIVGNENVEGGNEGDNESEDWVDLGLPSGLLWATRNVGASIPEGYGDYFAWGETQTKDDYSWATYRYANGDWHPLATHCTDSNYGNNGFADSRTTLLSSDDAATVNVPGSRMPTYADWEELVNNTTSQWTSINGVNGRIFTGPNGKTLFLPAAGYRWDVNTNDVGEYGDYWSSSLGDDGPDYAWNVLLGSDRVDWYHTYRSYGYSVRPVKEGNPCLGTSATSDTTATAEDSILWHGTTYTESGDYTYNTTTAAGCDSTVTLHLTITQPSGNSDMDWVDLGLPSGLLWAVRNVGASSPEDYGDYFAWGETQPKDNYSWETYRYANGNNDQLTKYCSNSDYGYNGFTDNLRTLTSDDDAAAVNVPGSRMPTRDEWKELVENCTWEWTTQNRVNGYRVTGPNGNVLFLPAAGYRWGDYTRGVGSYGYYWSSSLYEDYPYYAWYLGFSSGGVYWYRNYNRYSGFPVRPVRSAR